MSVSASLSNSSRTLLQSWERAFLVLPALVGLLLGFFPLFLPRLVADVVQFPPDDAYLYQLEGAATLGFGVALTIGLFQKEWLFVRLPVMGVLIFQLAAVYACVVQIVIGPTTTAVFVVLVSSLLCVAISGVLLARHRGVPHLEPNLATVPVRLLLIVGAAAAGIFGLLPLLVPNFFTLFHLHMNAPFIARLASAASLGYAVMATLGQRALQTREIFLIGLMAAIFNGVSGVVSLFYLTSDIILLPWLIAPVGLLVLVACLLLLRQILVQKA
jgi:hypothetical protein